MEARIVTWRLAAWVGLSVCLCAASVTVRGAERLSIRVSPTLSLPPAFIVVRAFVEADADNRALEVVADSNDFYASSRVPLNGAQSPRLSEVRFGGLPEGSYRITVSLVGTQGPRALATRAVQVGLPPTLR